MVKIMIVEDSNLMVAVITNFLKKHNKDFAIVTAHNGLEAIEKYRAEKPDLTFMDIKMPGMDGIDALEKIRAEDATAKIVMCTALQSPEHEARAKKAGAAGYIMKPFSSEDIKSAVQKNLGL